MPVDRFGARAAAVPAMDFWIDHLWLYLLAASQKMILKLISKMQKWNKRGQIEIRSWPLLRSHLLHFCGTPNRGCWR
jgi:hypothetical protein